MIVLPDRSRVMRYVLLPEILPRLRDFQFNTHYIAYLIALIFSMTRLLPWGHPYIRPSSMGTFGVRDVFAAARLNLKPDLKHIDQYIIYFSLLAGTGLFIGMVSVLVFLLFTQAAHAVDMGSIFVTPHPEKDIALNMLDKTFQVPGIFYSDSMPLNDAAIVPFAKGLQALFSFYSYGVFAIGGMIVIYYIVALVLESAQSGTPFGQRFASYYAPMRLVIAILLLVPLSHGYSAGQYMVFHIAKWGSGLGTNAWLVLNQQTGSTPIGVKTSQELIAKPMPPEFADLMRYYAIVNDCRAMYDIKYGAASTASAAPSTASPAVPAPAPAPAVGAAATSATAPAAPSSSTGRVAGKTIKPYIIRYPRAGVAAAAMEVTSSTRFEDAYRFSGQGTDIHIVYGDKNDSYDKAVAGVRPYCGHIRLPSGTHVTKLSTYILKDVYFQLMWDLWEQPQLKSFGQAAAQKYLDPKSTAALITNEDAYSIALNINARYNTLLNDAMDRIISQPNIIEAYEDYEAKRIPNWRDRGWGGAGIWFNDLASTNGAVMSAVVQTPEPQTYPAVMQHALLTKKIMNPGVDSLSRFTPNFIGNLNLGDVFSMAKMDDGETDARIADFLGKEFDTLNDVQAFDNPNKSAQSTNPITGYLNMVFGTGALMELRHNQNVHPLAKMAALGRGILDRALMYFSGSFAMAGLSAGLSNTLDAAMEGKTNFGSAFQQFATALKSFALVGLTVGFVLYYVIPMLPFMYFFFAVGRWVKGIFEAMVCVPLWALAHLRIDGDGIPGQAAANGYFILLELFLRPVMTLFGLMAAISIFSAQSIVLDAIFDTALGQIAGHTVSAAASGTGGAAYEVKANDIDQFFYAVVYAVLVYIMALASFKLIDLVPNGVLRWIGQSVPAFSDKSAFEAESTIQMAGIGGYQLVGEVVDAGQDAARLAVDIPTVPAGMAIRDAMKRMQPPPNAAGG